MNKETPIKLDLILEEVDGIITALGELPTRTNAFSLMMKIRAQAMSQIPAEEPKAE